jgi:hypothetical protein
LYKRQEQQKMKMRWRRRKRKKRGGMEQKGKKRTTLIFDNDHKISHHNP